jgi:hypothetical protein
MRTEFSDRFFTLLMDIFKTTMIKFKNFENPQIFIKDLEYKFLRLKSKCNVGLSIFNLISMKFQNVDAFIEKYIIFLHQWIESLGKIVVIY